MATDQLLTSEVRVMGMPKDVTVDNMELFFGRAGDKDGPGDRPSTDRAEALSEAWLSADSQWLRFRHLSNSPSSQARRGTVQREGVREKFPDHRSLAVLQEEGAPVTWRVAKQKWLEMLLLVLN